MPYGFHMKSNVIEVPRLSDLDSQFLLLERQKHEIKEQAKLIAEKDNDRWNSNRDQRTS